MTGKMTWLPVVFLILGGGVAAAQTPSVKGANFQLETLDTAKASQKQEQTAMYEDIEIMRRLLSSKLVRFKALSAWNRDNISWLDELYPSRARDRWSKASNSGVADGNSPQMQFGENQQGTPQPQFGDFRGFNPYDARIVNPTFSLGEFRDQYGNTGLMRVAEASPLDDIEGSYLPGCGIVYTVTLPPPQRKPTTQSTSPQPKPLTDWERVRKQLHGEKEPDKGQQAPAQPREPSVTDVILKTLFENGHHFVRLNDNENLTVAITFRPAEQQGGQATAFSPDRNAAASRTSSVGAANTGGTSSSSATSPLRETIIGSTAKTLSSAQDYLLLGDLHMRQGQANNALNAYQRALNDLSLEIGNPNTLGRLRELHQKLAQAYLSLGDVDNARKEFDELDKLQKHQAPKRDTSARPAETKLPRKLMISAPKKLLEQAGTGKMSFEEFRKAATVDELNFSSGASASSRAGDSK
jgi:hypothetical protein